MSGKPTLSIAFIIFALLCLSAAPLFSQKEKKDVQIIEFGADGKEAQRKEMQQLIIKTNPLSFLYGSQMVEVERELSGLLSVQAGLGATFRSASVSSLEAALSEIFDTGNQYYFCSSDLWAIDICDDYRSYDFRKQTVGYKLALSGRLFFENDGFEGLYVSPSLVYSRKRYKVQNALETSGLPVIRESDNWNREYEDYTDFTVRLGNSVLHDILMYEYYIGVGIRNFKAEREDLGFDDSNVVRYGTRQLSGSRVHLEIGLRLGIQL